MIRDFMSFEYIVDLECYESFIACFNDRNLMHTSDDFAKKYGFREKIMHGNILNGFLSNFIGQKLDSENVVILGQSIKYRRPIYLNDLLVLNVELNNASEAVGVYSYAFTFERKVDSVEVANGIISYKKM